MTSSPNLARRASGVLLHPSSLPGPGIGSLGAAAYRFVDWLADAGQSFWQILPLVAVDEGGSPYNGLSAVAGNPLLVDLEPLVQQGLLSPEDARYDGPDERVDFAAVSRWKAAALDRAHAAFRSAGASDLVAELARYRAQHASWLEDFALFRALRRAHHGAAWTEWPAPLRDRQPAALEAARREHAEAVDQEVFRQFLFDRQWSALRRYANERGIGIIGDVPIFVAHDSADVWANPGLFFLDEDGRPEVVSGVPPDYFSETGQRWGNPLYRWDRMRERGYRWWIERFRRTLQWVDRVRIDHFRGFESYWEIPATEETAVNGQWRKGPGADFFHRLEAELGELPLIAEDLGLITEEVEALRDELELPGMRVLQFAFDGDPRNPHLPANYPRNAAVYTGTHDNDTTMGWWSQASAEQRRQAERLFPRQEEPVHWQLMEVVLCSSADLAVVPVQDVLGLDSGARMNTPGTTHQNWTWRLRAGQLTPDLAARMAALTRRCDR